MTPRLLAAALLALLAARGAAQLHAEIHVGHDGAGRLVARLDSAPFPLKPSVLVGIDGFAAGFPGVSSMFEDLPDDGFLPLDPAARVAFVLEVADEGLSVLNDHGTAPLLPGEPWRLGPPPFDMHPVWILAPGTDGPRTLRLRLHDEAGVHADSAPFTAAFEPVADAVAFACPMSCLGGTTYARAGDCPECGMLLRRLDGLRHEVAVEPEDPAGLRAGAEVPLRLRLFAPDGGAVDDLLVVHEKLVHLLIVSADLAWFAHEHPERQDDGSFTLRQRFPHGGRFTLFHDFTPAGAGMQVVPVDLAVAGEEPPPRLLVPTREAQVDGFAFSLQAPQPLAALVNQRLVLRVTRDGAPVNDLEPFLGAPGHLVVIRQDRRHFVHTHPVEPAGGPAIRGPEIVFPALFPAPGRYKAWAQVQHAGRVLTAPFVVDVVEP